MHRCHLSRLSVSLQEFILEVEADSRVNIEVVPRPDLDSGGPFGHGKLEIMIDAQRVRLFAPTNGYFPDGAVRHEVLHMHRFHVEKVPKLALADEADWNPAFSDSLGVIDNALEHLIIVPKELEFHPDRRQHWEAVMANVWTEFPSETEIDRRIGACLHWAFLRHVLPDSPQLQIARNLIDAHDLLGEADDFAYRLLASLASKEAMAAVFFDTFAEISKSRVAFEYVNSMTGTTQMPIP